MAESVLYNPLNHSLVQAFMKADGYNSYEVPDYVDALLFSIKRELERVYWNFHQEQLEDRKDRQLLDVGAGFEYRRYFWGDCDCGFEEKDYNWSESNDHESSCYYKVVHSLLDSLPYRSQIDSLCQERNSYPWLSPEANLIQEKISKLSQIETEEKDKIYKAQCEVFGIPWDEGQGCAVHCTCGHDQKYNLWRKDNDHSTTCSPQLPNMKFEGVLINWYKYMGRGMSTNVDWDERQWRQWFDRVMKVVRRYDICLHHDHGNERVQIKSCKNCN